MKICSALFILMIYPILHATADDDPGSKYKVAIDSRCTKVDNLVSCMKNTNSSSSGSGSGGVVGGAVGGAVNMPSSGSAYNKELLESDGINTQMKGGRRLQVSD